MAAGHLRVVDGPQGRGLEEKVAAVLRCVSEQSMDMDPDEPWCQIFRQMHDRLAAGLLAIRAGGRLGARRPPRGP